MEQAVIKETRPTSQMEGAQTRQSAPTKTEKDQEMWELSASSTHQVMSNLNMIPLEVATHVEGTNGHNTSKAKLSFNLPGEKNDSKQGKWANLNVATPLWPSVRMKLTLPKLGIWSPPGLPNV